MQLTVPFKKKIILCVLMNLGVSKNRTQPGTTREDKPLPLGYPVTLKMYFITGKKNLKIVASTIR